MIDSFEIGCPKCGSTQITANKKGYSAGKALTGAILTGGIGLLAGFHGSKKVVITCLACGNRFLAGEGKKIYPNSIHKHVINGIIPSDLSELNRKICPLCKTENLLNYKYCRKCTKYLPDDCEKAHSDIMFPLKSCSQCKNLTPKESQFCVHCRSLEHTTEFSPGCIIFYVALIIIIIVSLIVFLDTIFS